MFGESAKKSISNVFVYNNYIHDCDTGWAESLTATAKCSGGIAIGGYEKNLGWVMNVKVMKNRCTNNGLKDGAIITLAKCKNVTIKDNVLKNKKSNSEIIYYALSKSYIVNVKIS